MVPAVSVSAEQRDMTRPPSRFGQLFPLRRNHIWRHCIVIVVALTALAIAAGVAVLITSRATHGEAQTLTVKPATPHPITAAASTPQPTTSGPAPPTPPSAVPKRSVQGGGCPRGQPGDSTEFRLLIPTIGVDAHVEPLGVDADGSLATPAAHFCDVGWYSRGVAPGDPGDAVFDGHLDWNGVPAVLWKLSSVRAGDMIVVVRSGVKRTFRVDSIESVAYDSHPANLFVTQGPPRLSLITCAGRWDARKQIYEQRLIVDAQLVS